LTYKTLAITSDVLLDAVDEWISDQSSGPGISQDASKAVSEPILTPVLVVALHACGSLTPSTLRAFLSRLRALNSETTWVPRAAVVVGCCYNLLEPRDFPLSAELSGTPSGTALVKLTPNHLQLAAQVPDEWLRTEASLTAAKLALKKVVWRALLESILRENMTQVPADKSDQEQNGPGAANRDYNKSQRLGRLNDAAYSDWDTFLARAGEKLGVNIHGQKRDLVTESRWRFSMSCGAY